MHTTLHNRAGESIDFTYHPGSRADALVLLGHGLSANKDRPLLIELAERLCEDGWPCLRFSFSGNGGSQGEFGAATIAKEADDLGALLDQLKGSRRIAYIGHSMGAAVGTLVAARDERINVLVSLAGMVLPGPFYQREFANLVPGQDCLWDDPALPLSHAFMDDMLGRPDLLDAAAQVRAPWLFVHGDADDLVPVSDSEAAYAAAREPKNLAIIHAADHSFTTARAATAAATRAWLAMHL